MKKVTHGYVMFDSSESFEKWQSEHEDFVVSLIQPIVSGFDIQGGSTMAQAVTTKATVFVSYWREKV